MYFLSGECPADVATKRIGEITSTRWLTTGSHVLRLYLSEMKPTKELKRLTAYTIRIYGAFWFMVKWEPQFEKGASNLLQLIKNTDMYCNKSEKDIVSKVFSVNAFFLHPENVVVGMLASDDVHEREEGIKYAKKSFNFEHSMNIREFKVPTGINFEALDLKSVINLSTELKNRIPFLEKYSLCDILKFAEVKLTTDYKSHSQDIERSVKLTSESVERVTLFQDGMSINKSISRRRNPNLDKKSNYV